MKAKFIDKFAALITAAFGLVAALAWNEAIKAIFIVYIPEAHAITGQILYAIFVTFLAVFATLWIAKVSEKAK
jgi:hypothetical protein